MMYDLGIVLEKKTKYCITKVNKDVWPKHCITKVNKDV